MNDSKKSIEDIWKEGFFKEGNLYAPKVNELYHRKSKHSVEQILQGFKKEVQLLIPLAIILFLFNIVLDNDNSVFWGIVCALPCLLWFYLGQRQLKSLKQIDYGASCYDYLLSVQHQLDKIHHFNKRLSVSSVPIILFPMLIYTYFKNPNKTMGELFGIESWDWSSLTIFGLLPLMTLIAFGVAEVSFKKAKKSRNIKIDELIKDLEELKS
ncbi:hypothetical protein [Aureispira anguillae]|uniref:Uncharacterized protein n=1 Tax=Aureispira anguillae TaxID=2864201 RepID=A0A916DP30_9BACT|nr:hypothetical protein [Aureispira anguillae]BDS10269.1 hypothetical protein AsAng_0009770 [Aureispira anguillae]